MAGNAARRAPSLEGRIALAIALTAGFYLLALGIALALIGFPISVFASGDRMSGWLAVVMVAAGVTVLRAIAPRALPEGVHAFPLAPHEQPRLRAELAAVARAAGQEPPPAVYLDLDVNAAVTEVGGSLWRPGRRVLILGLPLLAGLTREEFRAILAHEYGHYAGGDLRPSRWLWRARMVIGRTIGELRARESLANNIVAVPFEWYGRAFLRVTAAVSRREELAADAYAARTAGRAPHRSGLRRLEGYVPLWERYWYAGVVPVLSRDRRPPLGEGFLRMLHTDWAQAAGAETVRAVLAAEERDPYASHPVLAERLAALEALEDAPERIAERNEGALTLLDDVDALEARLLQHTLGESELRPRLEWHDVGREVELAIARERIASNPAALAGRTAGALPVTPAELDAVAARVPELAGVEDSSLRRRFASTLVAYGLVTSLVARGWQLIVAAPSDEAQLVHGPDVIRPYSLLRALCDGIRDQASWWEEAHRLGIAEVPLTP